MSKSLYLESVSGVAGDMFAASFIDARLVTTEELNLLAQQLGFEGVLIATKTVKRAMVSATHLSVTWRDDDWKLALGHETHHQHHQSHRPDPSSNLLIGEESQYSWHAHYANIDALLARSELDDKTSMLARRIFRILAEAEGAAHGIAFEEVAFHEVGAIDSIMDVVMAAYCLTKVQADAIFASPIKPGRGFVTMQHGTHPIPPPATAKLLVGLPVAATPIAIQREDVELSTPTGVAIVKALDPAFLAEMPAGRVLGIGMGAGTMDLGSFPNVFRITLLEDDAAAHGLPYETDSVVEIVCNIDDDTAEHIAWITQKVLEKGALDVWQTPAIGKKGRVLVCLSVLVDQKSWASFADWLLRQSTTFGLRYRTWDRLKLSRTMEKRRTATGTVAFKIGKTLGGEFIKEKAEHDDVYK